jgi:hypothetical protein
LNIHTLEIAGLEPALYGMRNPKESWDKSDSYYRYDEFDEKQFVIGENDLDLAKRLTSAGTEHCKFNRMIQVWVDISAPLYWWKEFDTYKVGTTANSTSTMHKITSRLLNEDDFEWDEITEQRKYMLNQINNLIKYHNDIYTPKEDKPKIFREIIQDLPCAFIQTRTVNLNYGVLRNMYKQRRHHKLIEWHMFCDWIENLPYADDLLING